MALISNSISDLLFLPPIGAAMALIVGAPNLPLAQPRNVVVGHLIGCITGILMSRLLGVSIITAAIAAGIAFALMLIARAAHSPATATAIVTALMPHGPDISNNFRYPTYWW